MTGIMQPLITVMGGVLYRSGASWPGWPGAAQKLMLSLNAGFRSLDTYSSLLSV